MEVHCRPEGGPEFAEKGVDRNASVDEAFEVRPDFLQVEGRAVVGGGVMAESGGEDQQEYAQAFMLAAQGLGAIIAVMLFPKWRARYSNSQFVQAGPLAHATATLANNGVVNKPHLVRFLEDPVTRKRQPIELPAARRLWRALWPLTRQLFAERGIRDVTVREIAREAGQRWIRLGVLAGNERARSFYLREGYGEILLTLEKKL